MGTIKNFEDLEIWKISRELVNLIYSDLRKCHDFAFRDQITRAGISSMNNIRVLQAATEFLYPIQ